MARTSKNTPSARRTSTATNAAPRSRSGTAQKKQVASTATTEAEGGAQPNTEDQDGSDQGEIAKLRAQLAKESEARKAAEARVLASRLPTNHHHDDEIVMIPRPKGEAGDAKRGFNLRTAMELDGDSKKDEFEAIQRSIRTYAIEARIDFDVDYRKQDVDKLANVFKLTRKAHPYLTVKRFPANWASAEILKQFLRNRRRYAVKKGRLESRAVRKLREAQRLNGATGEGSRRRTGLRNVDDDDDEPRNSEDEH